MFYLRLFWTVWYALCQYVLWSYQLRTFKVKRALELWWGELNLPQSPYEKWTWKDYAYQYQKRDASRRKRNRPLL